MGHRTFIPEMNSIYGITGECNGMEYGIIARSISDIMASRLVCLCAKRVMTEISNREGRPECSSTLTDLLMAQMRTVQRVLDLPLSSFDSTLSIITLRDGVAASIVFGDEYVQFEYEDQNVVITKEFKPNIPFSCCLILDVEGWNFYRNSGIEYTKTVSTVKDNKIVHSNEQHRIVQVLDANCIHITEVENFKSVSLYIKNDTSNDFLSSANTLNKVTLTV